MNFRGQVWEKVPQKLHTFWFEIQGQGLEKRATNSTENSEEYPCPPPRGQDFDFP